MNHLKDAIGRIAGPLPPLRLEPTPRVVEVASRLPPGDGADQRRPHRDYDALAHDFRDRLSAARSLNGKELRDAAWCLWTTNPALADDPVILATLLERFERHERKPPGRALASSYVTSFEPDRPGIEDVSATLQRIADRLGRPWARLHRDMRLFHMRDGPQTVARQALDRRTPPTAILREGGLSIRNAESDFATACAAAALDQLTGMEVVKADERLDLVRKLALDQDGKLIFDKHAPSVARALVRPFGDGPPPRAVRDRYLDVLLNLFKDPRLPQHGWARMPDEAERVRRWLTEQTLRQFLDVVDRVAEERMWKYRRAFWEAVYQEELISEAWVVFERQGARMARQAFGKDISFAIFDRRGTIQAGHAVLLLRIGRGMVAEWSHNGKCVIWDDADSPDAPILYRRDYSPDELRAAPGPIDDRIFACVHHSASTYGWQKKVAAKIEAITNVRIRQAAYEVP